MVISPKSFSATLLLVALVSQLHSQDTRCGKHIVTVNVQNKQGQFVQSLQSSDFLARIQGKELDIISAAERPNAPRIVIVLNASENMVGFEGALQKVTDEIVHISSDKTQLALLIFSDRILQVVEFGKAKSEISSAVNTIPAAAGRSTFRDSLLQAKKLFGAPQAGDAVIVVSNRSIDYQSKTSINTLMQEYLSAGIRLAVVRPFNPQQLENEKHDADLDEISSLTGGFVEDIASPKQLSSIDEAISQKLERYYVLQVRTPPIQKATTWQLEVIDSSHKKRRDTVIEMPQKLLPCSLP